MMDILIKNLPILVVLCPLMTSLLVVLIQNIIFSWGLTTLSTFLTFLFSILLYQEIQIHLYISYAIGKWMPPLGIEYIIDKVAIIPIIIISGISFIATIFAYKIMPEEIEKKSM